MVFMNGLQMVFKWSADASSNGLQMAFVFKCSLEGFSMVFKWSSNGLHMVFKCLQMVFKWSSNGLQMAFKLSATWSSNGLYNGLQVVFK